MNIDRSEKLDTFVVTLSVSHLYLGLFLGHLESQQLGSWCRNIDQQHNIQIGRVEGGASPVACHILVEEHMVWVLVHILVLVCTLVVQVCIVGVVEDLIFQGAPWVDGERCLPRDDLRGDQPMELQLLHPKGQ